VDFPRNTRAREIGQPPVLEVGVPSSFFSPLSEAQLVAADRP
jgi:hypothetical protein